MPFPVRAAGGATGAAGEAKAAQADRLEKLADGKPAGDDSVEVTAGA